MSTQKIIQFDQHYTFHDDSILGREIETTKNALEQSINIYNETLLYSFKKLVRDFDMLSFTTGYDMPEIHYDAKKELCCLVFPGNIDDINIIEDYLRNRPFEYKKTPS